VAGSSGGETRERHLRGPSAVADFAPLKWLQPLRLQACLLLLAWMPGAGVFGEQELVRGAGVYTPPAKRAGTRAHHPQSKESPMVLRRTVLVTLAAAAATSSVAQTRQDRPLDGSAGSDDAYLRQTLAAGSLSLAVSRMAQEKLQTDDLREFAQLEAAEQETLVDVFKSLQSPAPTDPTTKPPGEAELDQRGREELENMRATPAGSEFDRRYLEAQTRGHLDLLRIQETYLNSGQNNPDLRSVAKLARTTIREHLQLLGDLESEIESGEATTGAAPRRDN
jgi:predicted outer membrane protein